MACKTQVVWGRGLQSPGGVGAWPAEPRWCEGVACAVYLRGVPVEAGLLVVPDRRLVAAVLRQLGSLVEQLGGLHLAARHLLHDAPHAVLQRLPDLRGRRGTQRHTEAVGKGGGAPFTDLYLEVAVDLHQQVAGDSDVVGRHHLPLEDGEGDVGARGQVQVPDRAEAALGGGWGVGLGTTLERDDLHVGHGLQTQTKA